MRHGFALSAEKSGGKQRQTQNNCLPSSKHTTKQFKLLGPWRSKDSTPSNEDVKREKKGNSNQGSKLEKNTPVAAKYHVSTSLIPKDNGRQTDRLYKDLLSNEIIKWQALRKDKTPTDNDAWPMSKTRRGSKNSKDASNENSVFLSSEF